jgi:hypothetical protein
MTLIIGGKQTSRTHPAISAQANLRGKLSPNGAAVAKTPGMMRGQPI